MRTQKTIKLTTGAKAGLLIALFIVGGIFSIFFTSYTERVRQIEAINTVRNYEVEDNMTINDFVQEEVRYYRLTESPKVAIWDAVHVGGNQYIVTLKIVLMTPYENIHIYGAQWRVNVDTGEIESLEENARLYIGRHKTRFVTPNDELVVKYSVQIGSTPKDVYDWLNSNFHRIWAESIDYWSTPHEMLCLFEENGFCWGDCEDISFLATSMFRAKGVPPEEVRTTLGYGQGNLEYKHAWTTIKIDGEWIPLVFGSGRGFLDYLYEEYPYTPVISWNDKCRWIHEENQEMVNIFLRIIENHDVW